MARARRRREQVSDASVVNANNGNDRKEVKRMAGLNAEQIQALLGKTRTRGVYQDKMTEFLNSGEGGIDVREQWPEFGDKQASTLKQGFDNARESKNAPEGAEQVKVIKDGEAVYLVNLAAAGVPASAGASTEDES